MCRQLDALVAATAVTSQTAVMICHTDVTAAAVLAEPLRRAWVIGLVDKPVKPSTSSSSLLSSLPSFVFALDYPTSLILDCDLLCTPTVVNMAPDQAYLEHILAQTRANIDFLAAHNHISPADADLMRARLSSANITSSPPIEEMNNLSVGAPRRVVPPPPPRSAPTQRARALWAYNEDGSVSRISTPIHMCSKRSVALCTLTQHSSGT